MTHTICILFTEAPEGTIYKSGHYYYLTPDKAQEYINDGVAEMYVPKRESTANAWAESPEPEEEPAPEVHVHIEERKRKPKLSKKKKTEEDDDQ